MSTRRLLRILLGIIILLSSLVGLSVSPAAAATTRYVCKNGCSGASPCYASIQLALDHANSGDEIRVCSAGSNDTPKFYDGSKQMLYVFDDNISLVGGYNPSNWSAPGGYTVLDAESSGRHLTSKGHPFSLERFILRNGEVGGGTGAHGGSIYIEGTTATIRDCQFDNNSSAGNGGGIFFFGAGGTVKQNMFYDNSAGSIGGGIAGNNQGSGSRPILIIDNSFTNNSSSQGGGVGLYNLLFDSVVEANTFAGNTAANAGGGVALINNVEAVAQENIFSGNTGNGRDIHVSLNSSFSTQLINNVLLSGGTALHVTGNGAMNIDHNTVRNAVNGIRINTSGGTATLRNNLLTESQTGLRVVAGTVTANNNHWWNNTTDWSGSVNPTNNHYGNPQFLSAFHVGPASAAKGQCPRLGHVLVDIDGQDRPNPATCGADEQYPVDLIYLPIVIK